MVPQPETITIALAVGGVVVGTQQISCTGLSPFWVDVEGGATSATLTQEGLMPKPLAALNTTPVVYLGQNSYVNMPLRSKANTRRAGLCGCIALRSGHTCVGSGCVHATCC